MRPVGADLRPYLPFILILFFGTFMRFHALDRQSLWKDELSTIQTISAPPAQLLHRFQTQEMHPPLYFLQLKAWKALHLRSLVRLRANSAFWGSLSLVLIYFLGRMHGGNLLGLAALSLLALSPYHLAYSQELRPYAMGIALGLAALWCLERRSWILLGFSWTALLYTHYWGVFIVAGQFLYGWFKCHPPRFLAGDPWIPRQKPGGMTPMMICASFAVLAFSAWAPVLASQLQVIDQLTFWTPAFSVSNLAKVFLAYTGMAFPVASSVFYLPARVWALALIGLAFVGALVLGLRHGPRSAGIGLLVGLGLPWLLSVWKPSVFVWYRYPVLMVPLFTLLAASGFVMLRRASWRVPLIILALGSQAWGDWLYFHRWQKANPKSVVQYVHRLRRPQTIVVRPAYYAELFNFYDQGTTLMIDAHLLDSPEKRAALKGRDILLLAFDVPSDPVATVLLNEYQPVSARYFPGTAHLGITVYELK